MAGALVKPFLKKGLNKIVTGLNVGFVGYELNDIFNKDESTVSAHKLTKIIENSTKDTETPVHTWIVIVFAIVIAILTLIKLFFKVKSRSENNNAIP